MILLGLTDDTGGYIVTTNYNQEDVWVCVKIGYSRNAGHLVVTVMTKYQRLEYVDGRTTWEIDLTARLEALYEIFIPATVYVHIIHTIEYIKHVTSDK